MKWDEGQKDLHKAMLAIIVIIALSVQAIDHSAALNAYFRGYADFMD